MDKTKHIVSLYSIGDKMRTIKVKNGTSRYKVVSDDGRKIGEVSITLLEKRCGIALLDRFEDIEALSIETKRR